MVLNDVKEPRERIPFSEVVKKTQEKAPLTTYMLANILDIKLSHAQCLMSKMVSRRVMRPNGIAPRGGRTFGPQARIYEIAS